MFAALPLLLLCFTAVASQKLERSPRRVIGGNDLDKTVWQNKLKWVVALDARVKGDSDTYSCGGASSARAPAPTRHRAGMRCLPPLPSGPSGERAVPAGRRASRHAATPPRRHAAGGR